MNKRALVIALLCAVVGLGLLQFYIRRLEQEVRGGEPVDILLARKDIAAGSTITEQHVAHYSVPERFTSGRNVMEADLRHVIGLRVSTTVRANEPLLWSDIAKMREDRSLANLVAPGMVAVPINASTFNGLLGPGDRVDVVFIAGMKATVADADGTQKRAVTLIQSTLVLAVGGNMQRQTGKRGSSGGGSVTLLVSPEQAQVLIMAQGEGDMELVLRNPDDLAVREQMSAVTEQDIEDPKRRAAFLHAHNPTTSQTAKKASRHAE